MDSTDTLIIGAGVIGLAIARELARAGHDVIIVEANSAIGQEISARNSEVIHAGLYYPGGSLKARLCVEGNALLYDYCDSHQVPCQRTGKLILAQPGQQAQLAELARQARANGCEIELLDQAAVHRLEPELHCHSALWSPNTGIVDSHALMLSLLGEAEAHGAMLALSTRVVGGQPTDGGIALSFAGGDRLRARRVINCAGLEAVALAGQLLGSEAELPRAHYAKGNYFKLNGGHPFRHLVYPLPEPGGLGVHLTLDLARQARFGPDVQWQQQPDYRVDAARAADFYRAIRRYWPGLKDNSLSADYAGVRPKIVGPGEAAADFDIRSHRLGNRNSQLINLLGIESPGLTSSLAIARHVLQLTRQDQ